MAYSDKVVDHYTNPRNIGTLDKSKTNVGTGLVGAPECGDVSLRMQNSRLSAVVLPSLLLLWLLSG